MHSRLEQKLAEEFPFMKRNPAALKEQPAMDLYGAFGCECGDGWYELIKEMCAEIAAVYANLGVEIGFVPVQVKEKFGALRVYGASTPEMQDELEAILDKYEEKSKTVCELCGESGIWRRDLSWKRTLCETHYYEAKNVKPRTVEDLYPILAKIGEYKKSGYTELEAINLIKKEREDTGGGE